MKTDLTGYPKSLRRASCPSIPRSSAVATGSTRRRPARVPDGADPSRTRCQGDVGEPRRGYDQIVVKAFINLIASIRGTCVILDTYEVALVHSANPDVTHVHRPVVRIVPRPKEGSSTGLPRRPRAEGSEGSIPARS